jgi:predicted PurR-regulated permease PerM
MASDPAKSRNEPREATRLVGWLALVLAVLCILIARDFIGTLVFASWLVTTFHPLFTRLAGKTNAPVAALIVTFSILVVIVAPLVVVGIVLASRLIDLVNLAVASWHSGNLSGAVAALFRQESLEFKISDLYQEAARSAPALLASVGKVFQVLSELAIAAFLFVLLVYGLFVHGHRARDWLARASPLDDEATRRLMSVYSETGRGILVGVLLILLLHGIVAAVGYSIVGLGRAIELGALTAVAGLVPGIGTGLLWVPLSIVLAVTGHTGQAVGVLVVGLVVGSADNALRPWLSKLGRVPLPTLPLFVAFFGGLTLFGASGFLLGPLVFAWTKGMIDLYVERKHPSVS